jgi:hypothetical protein
MRRWRLKRAGRPESGPSLVAGARLPGLQPVPDKTGCPTRFRGPAFLRPVPDKTGRSGPLANGPAYPGPVPDLNRPSLPCEIGKETCGLSKRSTLFLAAAEPVRPQVRGSWGRDFAALGARVQDQRSESKPAIKAGRRLRKTSL